MLPPAPLQSDPASGRIHADAVVVGGGIAGLWSAARLANAGFGVLLLENDQLGSGQTIASQGILHGGVKYALTATEAAQSIAEMPQRWHAALHDATDTSVYLPGVRTLSPAQYLWTTGGLLELVTAKAAAAAIRTEVRPVTASQACPALMGAPRAVSIHRVEEPILDPHSLVASLRDLIVNGGGIIARVDLGPSLARSDTLTINERTVSFSTIVLSAGAGNERLLGDIANAPAMQRRPLHMVMARGRGLQPLFGHCLSKFSDKPRLTITTQTDTQGRTVWYIGGQPAEEGVNRSTIDQIASTRAEVSACLPWIDLRDTQWATFHIDRAEARTKAGSRPDGPFVHHLEGRPPKNGPFAINRLVVWPTKLVFAPRIGDEVILAAGLHERRGPSAIDALRGHVEEPAIAPLPWDREDIQWT